MSSAGGNRRGRNRDENGGGASHEPVHAADDGRGRYAFALRRLYGPLLLDFRILGSLEVVGDDGPLGLGGPKRRALLAVLLLSANRVVSIDQIADDLYGDAPPATALAQIQAQISYLRKLFDPLGAVIETRPSGYLIRLEREQLDLRRFERLSGEAAAAASRGDLESAADGYRSALDLWRGPALADFARDAFAQAPIARLEDLRLAALEDRLDAELGLGWHAQLIGELSELVAVHPLRERLHGQLMLALYRSGRQAEALGAYRRMRSTLVEELGIEPSRRLQELERSILVHDSALDVHTAPPVHATVEHSILVAATSDLGLDSLSSVARSLAAGRELILLRVVDDERKLSDATEAVNARRSELGSKTRSAAFTSVAPARDVLRLLSSHDVELVLLEASDLRGRRLPEELAEVLEQSPAHVAIVPGATPSPRSSVQVPFGGATHDWAALELAAILASSAGVPVNLVGTRGRADGRRDASRLLADAAVAIQRLVDVDTKPLLVEARPDALIDALSNASAVVAGISPRWRHEGIGATRRALIDARVPLLLVHRGLRPGGLAPKESRTSYTWSLHS